MNEAQENIKNLAKSVVQKEAEAVRKLEPFIDDTFMEVLDLIFNSKGRLIITGIGKSAIIGNKIVATMNSTGAYNYHHKPRQRSSRKICF